MVKESSNKGPSRSVVDCATNEQLRVALSSTENEQRNGSCDDTGLAPNHINDWILPSYDADTTEAQSMKQELRRLQVLKSYLILDADREEAFERITRVAATVFNVPIALVSLVDLGRQWFMSNRGLPTDTRETPRKFAFCAHAIQQKPLFSSDDDMNAEFDSDKRDAFPVFIVPDATKDFRFCENPLVIGAPFIRFYAGAPLVSPEGYRLGTLCIISDKTRPMGLDTSEQRLIKDLAAMTVQLMVDRRNRIENQGRDTAQMIASTAHELMTPLTGVQLSLSMLKDDDELRKFLGPARLELLNTAMSCADLIQRICQSSVDDLRNKPVVSQDLDSATGPYYSEGKDRLDECQQYAVPRTQTKDLQRSLHMLVEPLPKKVPIIITVESSVPDEVFADDLKLFRAALTMLNHAANRTTTGSIHLKIFATYRGIGQNIEEGSKHDVLVFECEDTGNNISEDEGHNELESQPSNEMLAAGQIGLSSLKVLVDSLDGDYGYRARSVGRDGSPSVDSTGQPLHGAVFWFSIPLNVPDQTLEDYDKSMVMNEAFDSLNNTAFDNSVGSRTNSIEMMTCDNGGVCISSNGMKSSGGKKQRSNDLSAKMLRSFSSGTFRRKIMLRVDSKEQAEAINNSCLAGVFDIETRLLPSQNNGHAAAGLHRREKSAPVIKYGTMLKNAGLQPPLHNATWSTESIPKNGKVRPTESFHGNFITKRSTKIENPVLASALADFNMHPSGSLFSSSPSASPLPLHGNNETNSDSNRINRGNKSEFFQKMTGPRNGRQLLCPTVALTETKEDVPPPVTVSTSSQSSSSTRPKSALVIDDSIIILKTISRALSKLGYERVVQATNGMEGLEELKKQTYDIVLCDFLMPVMDGFDCVKQFREWEKVNRSWFHQFIVGISAHATNDDGDQGIQAGMDDFRSKPITIKILTELQESHLRVAGTRQLEEMCENARNISTTMSVPKPVEKCSSPIDVTLCSQSLIEDDKPSQMTDRQNSQQNGVNNLVTRHEGHSQVCLIATSAMATSYKCAKSALEARGWNVTVVQDGVVALQSLKARNWDAVIVDESLSPTNGMSCIALFRTWEGQNRVNGQKNIILMCDGPIPSPRDKSSIVHPPLGCCAVIPRPLELDDLQFILDKNFGVDIILRN